MKFCRVIENNKGEQLLLRIKPSDSENKADLIFTFALGGDDAIVDLTMGGLEWKDAKEQMDNYTQESAEKILKDPVTFVMGL